MYVIRSLKLARVVILAGVLTHRLMSARISNSQTSVDLALFDSEPVITINSLGNVLDNIL